MTQPPEKGSKEWVRNERIINRHPGLKAARDTAEGLSSRGTNYLDAPSEAYKAGWERIFGKKPNSDESES